MADGTIDLKFEIDFGDSIQKFESMAEASEAVRDSIRQIGQETKNVLPGMGKYITDSIEAVDASEKNINKVHAKIIDDSYNSSYERTTALKDRDNSLANISAILADVKEMQRISTQLSKSKQAMSAVIETLPELFQIARNATQVFRRSDVLPTDQQIRASMRIDDRFKKIQASWGTGLSDALTEQVLQYAVLKAVPQLQRGSFLSHFGTGEGTDKHIFRSFQEMLPRAFQTINQHKGFITKANLAKVAQSNQELLTSNELKEFYELLQTNAYAANAAEAAKLMIRENGRMGIRKGITRGMVNAMGGYMFDDIVNSATGMRMYGVKNVNDPEFWDSVARKGNKRFLGGMAAARRMSEQYGWFNADRYTAEEQNRMIQQSRAKGGNPQEDYYWDTGNIRFSPLLKSYEVARYTLDDLQNNRNWNNRKKFGQYKTPEEFHHFAIDESLHLNKIMRAAHGKELPHNAYLDDVIYVENDERLADPLLDPKIREQIIEQYANVINHGISGKGKNAANERYVFTRAHSGSGLEFLRKSVYDKIVKEDPTYFSAGLTQDTFNNWKDFAASMEYRNKNATPGQDIRKLFGSDMPMKIAVIDLEATTKGDKNNPGAGLNGASVISNRLVKAGFQGRAHGIKTALTTMDIGAFVDEYGGKLALTMATGRKDEEGKRLLIDRDVDMIINKADLKNSGLIFDGKSNAEITKMVLDNIREKGITANKTFADANGKTSWFSGQLAQIFSMDTAASQMFTDAFLKHYHNVGTYEGARDYVFAKDDEQRNLLIRHPELFGTSAIQTQIADYRKSIMAKMLKGDLFVPEELNARKGMAAPWLIDAFNLDMKYVKTDKNGKPIGTSYWDQFIAGTDVEKNLNGLTLGDNRVLFQKSLASKLGLARYPATGRSIQAMQNAAKDSKIAEFAKKIGLDPNGLYISTSSPLMTLLQSADFDGDVLEIVELATDEKKDATVQDVFNKVVEATIKRNEELYKKGKLSEEEKTRRNKQLEDTVQKGKHYSTKSGKDIATWISEYMQQSTLMGAPNATVRNAFQRSINADVATALIDAEKQYDANSTRAKKGVGRKTSQEQMDLLGKYKPFSEFFHMVDESRDENGNIDPAELRKRNFFAVNLPSATMSGSMRSQMMSRMILKNKFGVDINQDYDWNKIFDIATEGTDKNTALGRMQSALVDVYKGLLNADYIAPSNVTVAQLMKLKNRALEEEEKKVAADYAAGNLSDKEKELFMRGKKEPNFAKIAGYRLSTQGGNTIDNLVDYALTQDKLTRGENGKMFATLRAMGIQGLLGNVDLSRYFTDTPFDAQKYRSEIEANMVLSRNETLKKLGLYGEDQRINMINKLRFSPSMLMTLAKDPLGWAEQYIGGNWSNKPEQNFGMKLGSAMHAGIEFFMRQRMENQNNPLGEEGTEKAAEAALQRFNDALINGYVDESTGERKNALLSPLEQKKLKSNTTSGHNYDRLVQYYKNEIKNLFPESEYEVVGIEGKLNPNYGQKIGKDEQVESSSKSAFDLLFRNKKTGNYTMADIKTMSNEMTAQDKALYRMQQLIYASAMPDYIKNVLGDDKGMLERSGYILPHQGTFHEIDVSPEAVQGGMEKVKYAVSMIQNLAKTGFTDEAFIGLAQSMNTLFGSDKFNQIIKQYQNEAKDESVRNEHIQTQLEQQNGQGVAGALIMHDRYNQAIQKLENVDKFARKQESALYSDLPEELMHYNTWQMQYEQLAAQKNEVANLRNAGMNIEADDLEHKLNISKNKLDEILPASAVKNLQDALELLQAINKEEMPSKGANSRVEQYKQIKQQITEAADAYDVLNDKIAKNKERMKQIGTTDLPGETDKSKQEKLRNEFSDLKRQNEIYTTRAKEANALRRKLSSQENIYQKKAEQDTWKELNESKQRLEDIAAGKKPINETNILDEFEAYKKAIRQEKAAAKLYAKNGIIDENSDEYKQYIAALNKNRLEAKSTYLPHLINSSLDQFMMQRESIAGNVSNMQLSAQEKIDDIVRRKTKQIEEEKQKINKRFKGVKLTDKQKEEYDRLMAYYNKYDPETFREQLVKESGIRSDRLLRQYGQLQRSRFGNSRSILARAYNYRDAQIDRYQDIKTRIDEQLKIETDPEKIKQLTAASQEAGNAISELSGKGGLATAAFAQFGDVVGRVVTRLGRQVFQKALAETKRFVKEFDASMNEIQTITLKTDQEMQPIRKQTINKAIGLKTSVSNVATTEAALYRQGLSDTEVSKRTDAIIKFATVTKLNVAEATKIITTALQNDLVGSAQEAMDALVALGDSAATTAAEIGKGMQKAAASAKVAGVSYAELTALLTIGTSDTQLSGTQVGTALQTVFTRMRKLSLSGYAADVNGEKTTASDAEAALKAVGVDLWENVNTGKMRSAYEVLSDLAKVWQTLSDAQKSIVTNALAGTRQTNIFSTLMEGMSEDNGATLDKYLGLAEGSQGITETKYEIAMKSLSAAMDQLKSSFDAIVESWTNNGVITGVISGLTTFLQMIADLGQSDGGKIGTILGVIAGGIAGIATAALALKAGLGPISTLIGLIVGLAAGGIGASVFGGIGEGISSLLHWETEEEKAQKKLAEYDKTIEENNTARSKRIEKKNTAIEEVEKLGAAYKKLKGTMQETDAGDKLRAGLGELRDAFPEVSAAILDAIANLSKWEEAVNSAKTTGEAYLKSQVGKSVDDVVEKQMSDEYGTYYNQFIADATKRESGFKLFDDVFNNKKYVDYADWENSTTVWTFDEYKGNYSNYSPIESLIRYLIHDKTINQNSEAWEFANELFSNNPETASIWKFINDSGGINQAVAKVVEKNIETSTNFVKERIDKSPLDFISQPYAEVITQTREDMLSAIETDKSLIKEFMENPNMRNHLDVHSKQATSTFDWYAEQIPYADYGEVLRNATLLDMSNFDPAGSDGEITSWARKEYGKIISGKTSFEEVEEALEEWYDQQNGTLPDHYRSEVKTPILAETILGLFESGYSFDFTDTIDDLMVTLNELTFKATEEVEKAKDIIAGDIAKKEVLSSEEQIKSDYIGRFEAAFNGKFGKSPKEIASNLRKASLEFSEIMVDDFADTAEFISQDGYDADFIQKVLKNYVQSRILDGDERFVNVDKDGNFVALSKEGITKFLAHTLKEDWYDKGIGAITQYASANDYKYHVATPTDENPEAFVGYNKWEDMQKWVLEHENYTLGDVMDGNGNKAYQTVSNLLEAKKIEVNENNKEKELRKLLYEGYKIESDTEYEKDEKGDYKVDEKGNKIKKVLAQTRALNKYNSLKDLEDDYDATGLSPILAGIIGSNANIFGAYEMAKEGLIDYSEFVKQVESQSEGKSSAVDFLEVIKKNLNGRKAKDFATRLRTDSSLKGVYDQFKNLVGDAADAILNNIEDNIHDPNLMKQFDKTLIAQRIKKAMQFDQYYEEALRYATAAYNGTEKERMQLRGEEKTSVQSYWDYEAAVDRYANGKAKQKDFATIAAYDPTYTETELRNNYNNSSYQTGVQANSKILENELVNRKQEELKALFEGAGLSITDYGHLDEYITEKQAKEYAEKYNIDTASEVYHTRVRMMTKRDYANWKMNGFTNALLTDFVNSNLFTVDDNGNIGLKDGKETQATHEGVDTLYQNENDNIYRKIFRTVVPNEYKDKKLKDIIPEKDYNELLQGDPTLRNMLYGGASTEKMLEYIGLQAQGKTHKLSEFFMGELQELFVDESGIKYDIEPTSLIHAHNRYEESINDDKKRAWYDTILSYLPEELRNLIVDYTPTTDENGKTTYTKEVKDDFSAFDQIRHRFKYSDLGAEEANKIANNIVTLKYGNLADQTSLYGSYFGQLYNAGKANIAYGSLTDYSKRGDLAAYLGLDQTFVNSLAGTDSGKYALEALMREKNKDLTDELVNVFGEAFNIKDSLSGATDFSDLITKMRRAAEGLKKDVADEINAAADALEAAGNATTGDFKQTYDEALQNINKNTAEYQAMQFLKNANNYNALSAAMAITDTTQRANAMKAAGWKEDWNEAFVNNSGLMMMFNLRQNGKITDNQFNQFLNDQMRGAGKDFNYYDMLASAIFGDAYQNGQFVSGKAIDAAITRIRSNKEGGIEAQALSELLQQFPEDISAAAEGDAEALKRLNEQWDKSKIDNMVKYMKNAEDIAKTLTALKKGGKDGAQAIAQMRKEAAQLSNAALAIQHAKGKKGSQLSSEDRSDLAAVTGEDAELIKEMTEEEVAALAERAQESIDEQFADNFGAKIQARLNEIMADEELNAEFKVKAEAAMEDGELDLSEISAIAAELEDETLAELAAHAGTIGELIYKIVQNGDGMAAIAELIKGHVSGTGKRSGGGGGGGGGKSATDKLLEAQKRRLAAITHENTMIEIEAGDYARNNQIDAYEDAVNRQIAGQEKLQKAYQQNIDELKQQLTTVQEGSDDWYKLQEAIYSAEEAYAKINSAIDELNAKRLAELKGKYDFDTAETQHQKSMLDIYFKRAQRGNEYEKEKDLLDQQTANIRAQLAIDTAYAQKLSGNIQEEYNKGNTDTDLVREWKQELNSLIEKIAQTTEDIASIEANILTVNQEKRENGLTVPQYRLQMYGAYEGIYDRQNNYAALMKLPEYELAENEKTRQVYTESRDTNLQLLDEKIKESKDWYDVLKAIYEDETKLAELIVSDAEILDKRITTIQTLYQKIFDKIEHQKNMNSGFMDLAAFNNDYEAYTKYFNDSIETEALIQQTAAGNIDTLKKELLRSDLDEKRKEEIEKEIGSLEEQILQSKNAANALYSNRLRELTEQQGYETAPYEHASRMLEYGMQASSYYNNYDEYAAGIKLDTGIKEALIRLNFENIKTLREEQAELDKTSDAWQEYEKQINANIEKIAELNKQIRENEAKRTENLLKKQQNEDKAGNHALDMLGVGLDRANTLYDFQAYIDFTNTKMDTLRGEINRNHEQQRELESRLKELSEGDEEFLKVRDAIWAIKKDSAMKENEALKAEKELYARRLSEMTERFSKDKAPIEHALNMSGLKAQRYSYRNDYAGIADEIDNTETAYRNLIATIRDEIKELKREQSVFNETDKEWFDRETLINQAKEKLESYTNAIDENNKKRLDLVLTRQQNEDKEENHTLDMLGYGMERADALENEDKYNELARKKIETINESIETNKEQISELENVLKQNNEGDAEWLRTRDAIWEIKKDTAAKENEALKLQIELDRKRLEDIRQAYDRENAYPEHLNRMMDTAEKGYTDYGYYDEYRSALTTQIDAYQEIYDNTLKAKDAALEQMSALEKGTTAWYNARDAVYQYDEALANTSVTMLEKQQAIEASRIEELTKNFEDSQLENNVRLAAIRSQRQIYDSEDDFENYKLLGAQETEILNAQIADTSKYIEDQIELLKNTTKDTDAWRNLRKEIGDKQIEVFNMQAEIQKLAKQQDQDAVDHLVERMNWEDSNRSHNITMIQNEQSKYQAKDELSNYGIMLEKENAYRKESIAANERDIETLKAHLSSVAAGTDQYKKVVELIKKKEEAITSDTAAIEKNTKAIKENQNAIRKTRDTLEKTVENEIKAREEERKRELSAEVNLQDIILNTIKDRYEDEWDFVKRDIDKKKDALNKEKQLISERLNARKNAMDTEEKYRELEELKRQYALISTDPTRTKDAKEMAERIRELEKDISWQKATEEADSEAERIDQQIEAMDDYVSVNEENLQEMLRDNNNFVDEVTAIMQGGWEGVSEFLMTNNKDYINSLAEAQQEMLESWEETWKAMNGIIDTYWDQIAMTLGSYESFIGYMKGSMDYINASETGKAIMAYDWDVMYENWVKSGMISAEALNYQTDDHPWHENVSDKSLTEIFNKYGFDWLDYGLEKPEIDINAPDYNDYGKEKEENGENNTEYPDMEDYYNGVGGERDEEEGTSYHTERDRDKKNSYDDIDWTDLYSGFSDKLIPELADSLENAMEDGSEEMVSALGRLTDAMNLLINSFLIKFSQYSTLIGDHEKAINDNKDALDDTTDAFNQFKTDLAAQLADLQKEPETTQVNDYTDHGRTPENAPKPEDAVSTDFTVPEITESEPDNNQDEQKTVAKKNIHYQIYEVYVSDDNGIFYPKERVEAINSQEAASIAIANAKARNPNDPHPFSIKDGPKWVGQSEKIVPYAEGGYVDYTGLAMVHGTPTKPESFLDAYDTQILRGMLDAFQYVQKMPMMTMLDGSMFTGTKTSIGDVYVTLNEAKLENDADYDMVAEKVGKALGKQLQKEGFNIARYAM